MTPDDWIGRVGGTWADEWRRTDRSFAGLDASLEAAIVAAMPADAATLVDIGSGAGTTSLAVAAALPAARIVGLDLSQALVDVAAARASKQGFADRCRFVAGDATMLIGGAAPVDGLFSRHGVMFFDDPVAAFARLADAAAPDATLVFSCFDDPAANRWAIETVSTGPARADLAPGPFAFADPARVASILSAAGWAAAAPERIDYRYVAGAGDDPVADAVGFFRRIGPAARAIRDATAAERPDLLARLTDACAARIDGGEVAFPASAWIWTAHVREKQR